MPPESPRAARTLREIRCSFCGKTGDEVAAIVCGPTTDVAICNECVELTAEIIAEQTNPDQTPPAAA